MSSSSHGDWLCRGTKGYTVDFAVTAENAVQCTSVRIVQIVHALGECFAQCMNATWQSVRGTPRSVKPGPCYPLWVGNPHRTGTVTRRWGTFAQYNSALTQMHVACTIRTIPNYLACSACSACSALLAGRLCTIARGIVQNSSERANCALSARLVHVVQADYRPPPNVQGRTIWIGE